MAIQNPILAKQIRTDQKGFLKLTGLETVNWLDLHLFSFGNFPDRDAVFVYLEGSVDAENWSTITSWTLENGSNHILRTALNNNVLKELPPHLAIRWSKANSYPDAPYEILIQANHNS